MIKIDQWAATMVAEALRAENASFDGLRQICPHVDFVRYNSASLFCQNCGASVDRVALIAADDAANEAASHERLPTPNVGDLMTSVHEALDEGTEVAF